MGDLTRIPREQLVALAREQLAGKIVWVPLSTGAVQRQVYEVTDEGIVYLYDAASPLPPHFQRCVGVAWALEHLVVVG